jgi:hypothetical protein
MSPPGPGSTAWTANQTRQSSLFDPKHAWTADLRRPLILITLVVDEGDEIQLNADGSHRLFRAFTEGCDNLPAWILTAAETEAIIAGPNQKD